jgi:hypothetical protein
MQPQDVEIERSLAAVQEQAVAELKAASPAPAL